jgi:hypothetical protein
MSSLYIWWQNHPLARSRTESLWLQQRKAASAKLSWECLRRMGQLSLDRHTCRAIHLNMWHGDMLVRRHVLQRLFVNKPSPKPTLREHQNTGFSMNQAVEPEAMTWMTVWKTVWRTVAWDPNYSKSLYKKQTKWKMRSCWVNERFLQLRFIHSLHHLASFPVVPFQLFLYVYPIWSILIYIPIYFGTTLPIAGLSSQRNDQRAHAHSKRSPRNQAMQRGKQSMTAITDLREKK